MEKREADIEILTAWPMNLSALLTLTVTCRKLHTKKQCKYGGPIKWTSYKKSVNGYNISINDSGSMIRELDGVKIYDV